MAKTNEPPTLDAWIKAHRKVVELVDAAFKNPGSVPRAKLKRAVADAQRIDYRAM